MYWFDSMRSPSFWIPFIGDDPLYGEVNPENIITIAIEDLPGSEELSVGEHVYLSNAYGQPVPVLVTAKDETNITMDANHELAGKALNFEIELVEVTE